MSRSRARTAAITYSCVPNGFDCSFDRAYTFSYVSIFPALLKSRSLSMPLRHAVSSCSKTSASPPYASEPADRLSGLANMSFTGSPPPASAAGSPLPPDRRYLETNSVEREARYARVQPSLARIAPRRPVSYCAGLRLAFPWPTGVSFPVAAIPLARSFAIRLMSFTGTGLVSGKWTVPFRSS